MAAWKIISKFFDGQRVVCASLGLQWPHCVPFTLQGSQRLSLSRLLWTRRGQPLVHLPTRRSGCLGDIVLVALGFEIVVLFFSVCPRHLVNADDTSWLKLCVHFVVISSILSLFPGCAEEQEPVSEIQAKANLATNSYSIESTQHQQGQVVLKHNFGVVPIKEKLEHVFEVANDSNGTWTIQEVRSSCACAVPFVLSQTIEPKARSKVRVVLTTASDSQDQVNTVVIRFAEPETPQILLRMVAHVRSDLTTDPGNLIFVGKQPKGKSVTVHNFSKQDWGDLQVKSTAPWIRISEPIEIEKPQTKQSDSLLWRQAWRFDVSICPTLAKHEEERTILTVTALAADMSDAGRKKYFLKLPASYRNLADFRAAPSEFFFGILEPNQKVTQTVKVLFREGCVAGKTASNCRLTSVPERLFIQSNQRTSQCLELTATFKAAASDTVVFGKVCVDFDDEALQDMEIPFKALVKQGGTGEK